MSIADQRRAMDLLRRRRLHKNSGEVWRFVRIGADVGEVVITRESDGFTRTVRESYWLGEGWTSPTSRAGCQR